MQVTQVYELVNETTKEILGQEAVVNEDLSNLVDIGEQVINSKAIENFTRTLVDHIGKVIFVNRKYSGSAPKVLMDGWEYGSILEKIASEMPEATENESWELEDGQSYDPNIFYKPKVSAKFFNKRTTFEIDRSFTERQVKSAFSSATQMNAFLSMLENEVDKSLTVKIDSLVMRTINNMTAQTINAGGTNRVVNLLTMFNTAYQSQLSSPLTAADAIHTPEFIRYASYIMGLYIKRLGKMSTLFNIGGMHRFTPADKLHIVMLDEFMQSSKIFLQSDTFHDELVALPNAESVPYWQGSGTGYAYGSTSSIDVTIEDADAQDGTGKSRVQQSNILGVMFDRDALGVANLDRRVTTNYNPKAEFFNNFYKFDAGYFNDANENFVVFVASSAS